MHTPDYDLVLLDANSAIAALCNRVSDEMAADDEIMDAFDGNVQGVYRVAMKDPAEWKHIMSKLSGNYDGLLTGGHRAWVTLAALTEWKRSPAKPWAAACKQRYRQWLQQELEAVDASEAGPADAEEEGPRKRKTRSARSA